jgi:hypothetical protein
MDPTKIKPVDDAINNGGEMTYRSLIQDALSEGNEAIASWLLDKVKTAHEGSFNDIIEEAVKNANVESETYKPTDLAKKYWNEYFPEAEQQDVADEATLGKLTPDNTDDLYTEDKHFGEEQAEGLDNLLEGLKDTPHDNRW